MAVLVAPGTASADPWGNQTSDTGAHPDGGVHWYCFAASFPSQKIDSVKDIAKVALGAATDADVRLDNSCNFTSGSQTDVRWISGNLGGNVRGSAPCAVYYAHRCDRFDVTIDFVEIAEGTNDDIDGRKTICHELGHSVGLTHHDDGYKCMKSGPVPSTDGQWRRYDSHHIDHIDAWF